MNLPVKQYDTGIGDLATTRLTRIAVDHENGKWVDPNLGEVFSLAHILPLGRIAQRTMWPPQTVDAHPLCRSNDARTGFPVVDGPKEAQFPWAEAPNLDESSVQVHEETGQFMINCSVCPFTEWSGPRGARKPPRCQEKLLVPALFSTSADEFPSRPALFTFQRATIGAFLTYFSTVNASGQPAFYSTIVVRLDNSNKKGKVVYSTPIIEQGQRTNQDMWDNFYDMYLSARNSLTRRPLTAEEKEEQLSTVSPVPASMPASTPPVPPKAAPKSAPAGPPSGVMARLAEQKAKNGIAAAFDIVEGDVEDIPF